MPLIIAMSIILGMYIQSNLSKRQNPHANFSINSQSKIDAVIDYVDREYVDSVDVDQIVENVIPVMLEELDPHSVYISAADFKKMNEPLEGNFDGIGVQFNIQKDTVTVIKTISGGPSEKVGIHDGDRIVTVDDSLIAGIGITNNEVMKLLRGEKGTNVNVGIYRRGGNDLVHFTITRDKIPLYSVDVSYMVTSKTGFIKVTKFGRNTYKEFMDAIAKLQQQGMQDVIIDLRGNSGGYMDQATSIADEFLENGKLIVYTQGRARPKSSVFATHRSTCVKLGVTVLIDEWAASASEIVAGAIQDNDRGKIIGRRSFGKGLVQEPVMFNDGSSMRLTIARYYTPAGRCIQKSYENGLDEYFADIHERFQNKEFLEQDSIHFPDSLKYYTTKGRVVYGGGGIMPDIFVPADTSGNSKYLSDVSRKGLEYQFSFEFTDSNRKKLASFKTIDELLPYLNEQDLLTQFVLFAKKNGVSRNNSDLKLSGNIIDTQVKALIARNVLDNDGFYPIIKKIDKTLLEAIKITEKE